MFCVMLKLVLAWTIQYFLCEPESRLGRVPGSMATPAGQGGERGSGSDNFSEVTLDILASSG
jgi:hypothetical protein